MKLRGMRRSAWGLLLVGAAVLFGGMRVGLADGEVKPRLFVCGDSTSRNTGKDKNGVQLAGWGTPIAAYFDPAKVEVRNVGHAGTSSLTYYQGDWPKVLPEIRKGDLVLIVFGINDGGLGTPGGLGEETKEIQIRGKEVKEAHTYGWYLAKMATDAREKGATPMFLTVTTRNIWTNPKAKFKDATPVGELPADYDPKEDRIERGTSGGKYGEWTKEAGKKLGVPVFDLTNYCADLYEKMGREQVNKLYADHNHTYVEGAEIVARSIVAGLKGVKALGVEGWLSEKGKAVEAAEGKYVQENGG